MIYYVVSVCGANASDRLSLKLPAADIGSDRHGLHWRRFVSRRRGFGQKLPPFFRAAEIARTRRKSVIQRDIASRLLQISLSGAVRSPDLPDIRSASFYCLCLQNASNMAAHAEQYLERRRLASTLPLAAGMQAPAEGQNDQMRGSGRAEGRADESRRLAIESQHAIEEFAARKSVDPKGHRSIERAIVWAIVGGPGSARERSNDQRSSP